MAALINHFQMSSIDKIVTIWPLFRHKSLSVLRDFSKSMHTQCALHICIVCRHLKCELKNARWGVRVESETSELFCEFRLMCLSNITGSVLQTPSTPLSPLSIYVSISNLHAVPCNRHVLQKREGHKVKAKSFGQNCNKFRPNLWSVRAC